jgi:hypothetical protein
MTSNKNVRWFQQRPEKIKQISSPRPIIEMFHGSTINKSHLFLSLASRKKTECMRSDADFQKFSTSESLYAGDKK